MPNSNGLILTLRDLAGQPARTVCVRARRGRHQTAIFEYLQSVYLLLPDGTIFERCEIGREAWRWAQARTLALLDRQVTVPQPAPGQPAAPTMRCTECAMPISGRVGLQWHYQRCAHCIEQLRLAQR
jgi:hypothetical protein